MNKQDEKLGELQRMQATVDDLAAQVAVVTAEADQLDGAARDGAMGADYPKLAAAAQQAAQKLAFVRERLNRARAVLADALDQDQSVFVFWLEDQARAEAAAFQRRIEAGRLALDAAHKARDEAQNEVNLAGSLRSGAAANWNNTITVAKAGRLNRLTYAKLLSLSDNIDKAQAEGDSKRMDELRTERRALRAELALAR